jgi:hypothetical protein
MNIFYLHHDPQICATQHVDKHVVKMILESAQLLSTAHRLLDGVEISTVSPFGRKIKRWQLPDERDTLLYAATHRNHPSALWARQSAANYDWLYRLFTSLLDEYHFRYEKNHACNKLRVPLQTPPLHIASLPFTEPTPAMPEQFKVAGDAIQSYRNYYNGFKTHLFSWKKRSVPKWIRRNE